MKDLLTYIIDCGGACSTPANTAGMGNAAPPMDSDGQPGSGDIPNVKTAKAKVERPKKKKRKKKGEEE